MPGTSVAGRTLQRPFAAHSLRAIVASLLAALVAGTLLSALLIPAAARASDTTGTSSPRAVIIVGPSGSSTSDFLRDAEMIADQADAAGMRVEKVLHPRATWERVLDRIQGANLVFYLGHGNGWPSPYAPFQERTKNGFGLNPYEGAGTGSTEYLGGDRIRSSVRLAKNAVVVLWRSCYSSGNGESHHSPLVPSNSSHRQTATERVDNFAAAFLHDKVGAEVVMAFGATQHIDIPAQLKRPGRTMEQIFRTPRTQWSDRNGWIGTHDYTRDSDRTDGARILLDPHASLGHSRAITGRLGMTTDEFMGSAPDPDTTAPQLSEVSASASGATSTADAGTVAFSPNGDGVDDSLSVRHTVSEGSFIEATVTDASGATVRRISAWSEAGAGATTWDGRDGAGAWVPDGAYDIALVARDPAGNPSQPGGVRVQALDLVRAPRWDRARFNGGDGDDLASSATWRMTLTRDAAVAGHIEDASGTIVRRTFGGSARTAGEVVFTWDGLDGRGQTASAGSYRLVTTATTDAGTVTTRNWIWHGPFRINVDDLTPRRGQRLRVTVRTTESMAGAPRLRIEQPGLSSYRWRLAKIAPDKYRAYVTLKSSGRAGTLRLTASGEDAGGARESFLRSLPLS